MKEKMDRRSLSKIISYALRHAPDEYNLVLDKNGWTDINILLCSIRKLHNEYSSIAYEDLLGMVASSEKRRHEIEGLKIRALYGHSIEGRIEKKNVEPPLFLYHGTSQQFFDLIKIEGLKKMKRQYVHLSLDINQAFKVAERKTTNPIILKVKAYEAYKMGVKFYEEDNVWLCEFVPNKYIEKES